MLHLNFILAAVFTFNNYLHFNMTKDCDKLNGIQLIFIGIIMYDCSLYDFIQYHFDALVVYSTNKVLSTIFVLLVIKL